MKEKMSIKSRIKQFAFQRGILLLKKAASSGEVEKFLARFRDNYVSVEMVRIGGDGDGGYLLPNVFESISYCFSPGVEYTAKFEGELSSKYGIKSFMADASVPSAPFEDENFVFIPKFLGNRTDGNFITLSDWMNDSLGSDSGNNILQMDIEGGEYDVLALESAETLAKFSVMAIEFHKLQNMLEPHFLRMISNIFEKIYQNFSICHVHPNNCCGIVSLNGLEIPRVIEVSFIRNDLVDRFKSDSKVLLPHELDRKSVEKYEDISMPDAWWKK